MQFAVVIPTQTRSNSDRIRNLNESRVCLPIIVDIESISKKKKENFILFFPFFLSFYFLSFEYYLTSVIPNGREFCTVPSDPLLANEAAEALPKASLSANF